MKTISKLSNKLLLALFLAFSAPFVAPTTAQAVPVVATGKVDSTLFPGRTAANTTAESKWVKFQSQLKGFAVIILMVMIVIAAIMAAFQKVTWAINCAVAGVILFGGTYILGVISTGFN